jgi:hypothetical protein
MRTSESSTSITNQLEKYIHQGIKAGPELATDVLSTTEGILWGGPTAGTAAQRANNCIVGTGGSTATNPNPNPNPMRSSQTAATPRRTIKGNPNESLDDERLSVRNVGAPGHGLSAHQHGDDPVTGQILSRVGAATLWEPSLQAMTNDLHDAYFGLAASNANYKAVAPVGDAFMLAVNSGRATANPYSANALTDGLIDLWWDDNLHASRYGSYLSALTPVRHHPPGLDPQRSATTTSLRETWGSAPYDAYVLQQIDRPTAGLRRRARAGFSRAGEPGLMGLAAGRRRHAKRRQARKARTRRFARRTSARCVRSPPARRYSSWAASFAA